MKTSKFKQDKGVAGLTILLSLVVMLFIIGLVIMIFTLMGGELRESTYDELTAVTVANETINKPTTAGVTLAGGSRRDGACGTITQMLNSTSGNVAISSTNWTQTNCVLTNTTSAVDYSATWRVSYPYTWSADNTATDVMNETVNGISETTDWFDIFIVIGAMIVLILLTVIIITAIRSSGMITEAGSTNGANSVGTA